MHVWASTIYATIIFMALLAYGATIGAPLLIILLLAPIIISGAIIVLLGVGLIAGAVRWLWLSRGTLRLWRSPPTQTIEPGPPRPGS